VNRNPMYFTSLVAVLVLATALLSAREPTRAANGPPLAVAAAGRGAPSAVTAPTETARREGLAIAKALPGHPQRSPVAAAELAP